MEPSPRPWHRLNSEKPDDHHVSHAHSAHRRVDRRHRVVNTPALEVDRDLYPFTSRFMELSNGAKVHYVDEGKGEVTFLMLHGNPTWSFLYHNLLTGLAPDHRCVTLDYPGFGLSTAPAGFDFTAASHGT